MSKDKLEHKDELDCEVTVFDGAHNTCDPTEEGDSSQNQTAERTTAAKKAPIKDNYNI